MLIGRKKEKERLERLYNGSKAEFVAIYGRRRVGKTYLVNQVFDGKFAFHHTGLSPFDKKKHTTLKEQLQAFYFSMRQSGLDENAEMPQSWLEAFFLLQNLLHDRDDGSRQVVFMDELPWMDTPKSGFLTAFEHFWNNWASTRPNMFLIICGSSTTWILDNVINNPEGFYGRITCQMRLEPFNLSDCRKLLEGNGVSLTPFDIVQGYMALGGIPYYWGYCQPGMSLAQMIDSLFFEKNAFLQNEFTRLFHSLFRRPDDYIQLIRFLSTRKYGFTRDEIAAGTGITKGGGLSKMLKALEGSDFIISYQPVADKGKQTFYRLIDPFCIFYLQFIDNKKTDAHFWQNSQNQPLVNAWKGFSFESVCFTHIAQIKSALGISGVISRESAYLEKGTPDNPGSQIDLLIDRNDRVVNLCEIKFWHEVYEVSRNDMFVWARRIDRLQSIFPKANIHMTLISTFGYKIGGYSSLIQKSITLEDLFLDNN